MRALLTGAVILALLLYVDWKFIRSIFNRASSAGVRDPEEKLKRTIVDVVTKRIYIAEVEEFVRSQEFLKLLEEYSGEGLEGNLEENIERSYRSYLHRRRGRG